MSFVQVVLLVASVAQGDIVSSDFSLGYGYTGVGNGVYGWTTSETSAANTATTIGDFSFTPAQVGPPLDSDSGVTFVNRVLADGTSTSILRLYHSGVHQVPIAAQYNGTGSGGCQQHAKLPTEGRYYSD